MHNGSLLLCIMASWGRRIVVALSNLLIITTLYIIYIVFVCLSDHKFVAITFLFVHLRGAAGCCALGRAARLPRHTSFHWLRGRHAPSGAARQGGWVFGDYRRSIMASRRSKGCDQCAERCWGPPDAGGGCCLGAAAELMIVETFDTRLIGAVFPMLTIYFRCNAWAPI
jgi:hypothetical protein